MSSTQKALLLQAKQGSFALGTRYIPVPGPGELLVKIHATSLNPVDWKIQEYGVFIEDFPAVLGTDISGEVVKIGEGVQDLRVGDRVFCQGTWESDGVGFQQYTLTTAATTAKIPSNIGYEAASTIPVAFTCAYVGLYNRRPHGLGLASPLIPGQKGQNAREPIVILGGSSSVGQYRMSSVPFISGLKMANTLHIVVQLARLSGFSPIITTASLKHGQHLHALGATHVIDRRLSSTRLGTEVARVMKSPLKYVYDAISLPETQQAGYRLLSEGGAMAVTLPPAVADRKDTIDIFQVMGILKLPQNRPLLPEMYKYLSLVFEDESIRPNPYTVIDGGLSGVVEGLRKLKNDEVSGSKLVVRPQYQA